MKILPYKWYLSYWFTWILLTVFYFIFFFITDGPLTIIGLFVPVGPFSWIYMLGAPITVLVFLLTIIFADPLAFQVIGIKNIITKVIYNLYLLFFVTCFVDMVGWGSWISLMTFLGKNPIGDDSWAQEQYNLFAQQYQIPLISRLLLISIVVVVGIALVRNIIKSHSLYYKENQ